MLSHIEKIELPADAQEWVETLETLTTDPTQVGEEIPLRKMKDRFFVWIMPHENRILVTDIDMPPVAVFNIPALLIERMKNRGVEGSKSFNDWNKAVEYGESVVKKTGWDIEYNNAWGREVEAMEDEGEFCFCDNCDLPDACEDFGCAIKQGIRVASDW